MSTTFDLVEQPWVLVLDEHHRCQEVSLVDAFTDARRWRGLAGEMPTQQVAMLRLLLAICHRALREEVAEVGATTAWARWWAEGFPADTVVAYLGRWQHHFDLFDSEAPFMQVAGLHTAKGTTSGLSKLIAEVPDGEPYFTTRAGEGLHRVGPAEAARWVVHCQAFDPSGIKSGAVGDPRVKGGKGYPIGVGWCGNLGLVVAEGRNLAETLLLNLVLDNPSTAEDMPVWEREEPLTSAVDPVLTTRGRSNGPVELLVWQSRRIRLIPGEDGDVLDALVCNGDPHEMQNAHRQEAMSGWKRSANQEKKGDHGPIVYMPMRHDPERAVWRGLAGLLAGATSVRGATNDAPVLLPPLVEWLSALVDDEVLDEGHPVRFRAVGVEYGSNQSVIDGVVDDAMTVQAVVLADPDLRHAVVTAAASTDAAVAALKNLAGNLRLAAGGGADGARARAGERAWSRLDRPFREWANRLGAAPDIDDALATWHRTASRILRQEGEGLVVAAGEKAWRGREVSNSRGSRFIDSAIAEAWFRAALRKALDRAHPGPSSATENMAPHTGETA